MTLSGRLNDIHSRTHVLRRSTIPAAMRMIAQAGLTAQPIDVGAELVAGKFEFYPTLGWWRSVDGTRRGYNARTLIQAAKESGCVP